MNGSPALPAVSLSLSFGKIKHCLFEFFHQPLKFKFPTSPIHESVVGYYQFCLYLVLKRKMAIRVFFSKKQNIGSLKSCVPRFCTAMYCATGDQRSKLFKLMTAAAGPKFLFTACSGLVSSGTGFDLNHRSVACFTHHHRRCHSFWPRTTNWVAQVSGQRDWKWSTEQAFSGFFLPARTLAMARFA